MFVFISARHGLCFTFSADAGSSVARREGKEVVEARQRHVGLMCDQCSLGRVWGVSSRGRGKRSIWSCRIRFWS